MLLVAIIVFFAAGFNGQWRIGPDSASYAAIARSVAEGKGFVHPTGFEGNVSPGLVYLLATSFRVLGNDTFWPVLALFLLLMIGTLGLVYHTFLLHTDRPTAAVVTLMVGTSTLLYRFTFDVLNTIPFLFGMTLLLWSYERQRQKVGWTWLNYTIIVLSFAWMAAFRIVFINVLAAWLLVMFIHALRTPKRWRAVGAIVAVVIVLLLVRFVADPRARQGGLLPREQQIVDRVADLGRALPVVLPRNTQRLLLEETTDAMLGNSSRVWVIDGFLSIALIGSMIALAKRRLLWGVLTIIFLLQWLLFFVDARYFAPLMPLMAFGWWRLWSGVERKWNTPWARGVFVTMIALWPLMNVPRSIGLAIEQRRVPFEDKYQRGMFKNLREFSLEIMEFTDHDCWILGPVDKTSTIGYWSRRAVYPPIPNWLPKDVSGKAYIVLPMDEAQKALLAEPARGWVVGPQIASSPGRPGEPPWTLHVLEIPPKAPVIDR